MLHKPKAALLLLFCLFATGMIFPAPAAEENRIKIIVTNDVHGNVFGDDEAKRIGYAKLRGYLDALEKDGWTTYLLDAGDAFSGNAVAQFDAGKSVAALMGKAGCRVLNPGNHAFDYNQSEENELYYQNILLPAVRANAAGSVDAVSANITVNGETPPGLRREPVVLYEDDGLRIAVAGVTSPYSASMSNRRGLRNYDFGLVTGADGAADHAATKAKVLGLVADAVAPFDRPGDIVILLSHLGWDETEDYAHGQISGRDAALVPNVDFVVDSHSHNVVEAERIGEAEYGIAGRYLTNFEEITIVREGGALTAFMETKGYDQLAGTAPSEAVLAETRTIADRLGMGDRVFDLGTDVDLSDARIAEESTPLGRFICREMLAVTGADFALFNAGGIRAGLKPGRVTVGDVYDVVPFQNNLQTFRLTGEEVFDLFDPMPAAGSNGFPQFFGLTAYAYPGEGNRCEVFALLDADGKPVDPDGEYVFATINFLAEGGDGYSFPSDEMVDDFGDFFARFAEQLRKDGGGDLEALNENNALLLFDSRDDMEAAWDNVLSAAEENPDSDGEEEDIPFADVAEAFRRHCVRVFINGKTHDGEGPVVGSFDDDIRNERPTPVGGYWWDDRHVVIHDPVLHDDFIRSIEIALPGSDTLYPARVAARFTRMDAMLLEVLPGADGGLPEAFPLSFAEGDLDDAFTLGYGWVKGAWRLALDSGALGASFIDDDGRETAAISAQGIFVNSGGEAIGLSFGDSVAVTDGKVFFDDTLFSAEDADAAREELRGRLAGAVLETVFRLRITVDDDDSGGSSQRLADDLIADGSNEVRAAGLVVGPRSLVVPVALPHEGIARIDAISVTTADGRALPARFMGAFRNYMALFIETDEELLPADALPEGFARLNPLLRQNFDGDAPPSPSGEYIQRWRIDYALGRRRETADYDRWIGTFRGYRNDVVVQTRTNESDGSLAFDTDGRLVALSLTPRLIRSEENRLATVSCGFRPVDFLSRQLRAGDAFDPSMQPVDEGQGERLIDLGVEFQPLDASTARLFHAARATRAGEIGLLVTHVYPGSIAAGIGLQEHDILVRCFIEGRREPVDLRSGDHLFGGGEYEADMSSEAFQELIRFMPPPWPPRDNAVSALLTGLGAGRKVELEYLREGAPRRAEFVTAFFDPDYRSAPKEKFDALGMTVKPLTYEVARFFNKRRNSGVVVSRVEEGGKAAVAGLHHYLVITHVDGRAVEGLDDFAARVGNFENGSAASVELTADSFGKTRLVKIE